MEQHEKGGKLLLFPNPGGWGSQAAKEANNDQSQMQTQGHVSTEPEVRLFKEATCSCLPRLLLAGKVIFYTPWRLGCFKKSGVALGMGLRR